MVMKVTQKPPQPPELLTELTKEEPGKFVELVNSELDRQPEGKYVQWDELRHLTLPKGFTHRQLAAMDHFIKHSHVIYRIQEHRNSNQVTYETARTDLLDLVDLGLLRLPHVSETPREIGRQARRLTTGTAPRSWRRPSQNYPAVESLSSSTGSPCGVCRYASAQASLRADRVAGSESPLATTRRSSAASQ